MRIPGIVHCRDLGARGLDRSALRALARAGSVRVVGPWYVTEQAPEDVVRILALGDRPTCLDAAVLHGLWVPPHPGVHTYRPRRRSDPSRATAPSAFPLRRRVDPITGAVVPVPVAEGRAAVPQRVIHHRPYLRAWPDLDPVPEILTVLDHAARCLPLDASAILIESAWNRGLIDGSAVQDLVGRLPLRLAQPLSRVRPDAQSGTETRVRWWLESCRVHVRSQVRIARVGRVDLLVGRSWVIECDSRSFHDGPSQYREDRRRDLELRARGFTVTRLTWEQVFVDWDRTRSMLRAILRRGDHLRAASAPRE